MTGMLLSYARGDDALPFDPATSFVARLHQDLTARGFEVWFDRVAMPSRGLTFHQEIQDAVAARELWCWTSGQKPPCRTTCGDGVGRPAPSANGSSRSRPDQAVTPILRQGDYPLVPDELKLLHCEDFRDDDQHAFHLENLVRQLGEPVPPLGKTMQ